MKITIDVNDAKPVYQQIVVQIEQGVKSGALPPGARLPPIRQLAEDLEVNPNTVAKAFQILETNRIVRTLGRRGTVVHDESKDFVRKRTEESAARKLADTVDHLLSSGLSASQIRRAFDSVMKARA
jgi:GntR family transcriptional regulator